MERSRHWTDFVPDPLSPTQRRRVIGTWLNYRQPGSGLWLPTNIDNSEAAEVPYGWDGNFDFQRVSLGGPMQVFYGDSTDADNRVLFGARVAEKLGAWVQFKAVGASSAPTERVGHDRVRWANAWTNSHVFVDHLVNRMRKRIVLTGPGHPAVFRFAVKHSPSCTFEVVGSSGWVLRDESGDVVLRSAPVWAHDSTPVAEDDTDGARYLRVQMTQVGTWGPRNMPVIGITVHPDDLAGAVYPVVVDPDATLSGTSLVDNFLRQDQPNSNYSTNTLMFYNGGASQRHPIIRPDASGSLPSGSYSAMKFTFTAAGTKGSLTWNIYTLQSGNVWDESASDWNGRDASNSWLGSAGASTSGTDYNASGYAMPGSVVSNTPFDVTVDPAWGESWRDTANVGAIMIGTGGDCTMHSNNASNSAYWPVLTVTYTAGGGSTPYYYNFLTRRRRA